MSQIIRRLARLFSPTHSESGPRLRPKGLAALAPLALVVALAAMAVSASAASAAPTWKVGGVEIPAGKANAVNVTTAGKLKFEAGPEPNCNVTDEGKIWNEGGVGRDEITKFTIAVPCETAMAGCIVEAAEAQNLPWQTVTSKNAAGEVFDEIIAARFTNKFGPGCGAFAGVEIFAAGSIIGKWSNATHCLEFNKTPGLLVNGVLPANLTGNDCITKPANVTLS